MDVQISQRQTSNAGDAILTTTYADDGATRGLSFLIERNLAVATGATAYILIDYRTYIPTPKQLGQIYVFPPALGASGGPVLVNVYRETGYSGGGTTWDAINPNTLVEKRKAGTTITVGATGSNKGNLVLEYLVGGGSGVSPKSQAGEAQGLSYFIRDNTKKTLVEIINNSGVDITFHYGQVFYEI